MIKKIIYKYSLLWDSRLAMYGISCIGVSLYYLFKIGKVQSEDTFLNLVFIQWLAVICSSVLGLFLIYIFFVKVFKYNRIAINVSIEGIKFIRRNTVLFGGAVHAEFVKWKHMRSLSIGREYYKPGCDSIFPMKDVFRKIVFRIESKKLKLADNSIETPYIFTDKKVLPGKTITFYQHNEERGYDEIVVNAVLNKNKKKVCSEIKQFIVNNIDSNELQPEFKVSLQERCVSKPASYFF